MKIDITKQEYRHLMDILYVADWVMNAHGIESSTSSDGHDELRDKLHSYSKQMDAEDIIDYSPGDDDYSEDPEYEQHLQMTYLQPYDQQTFWDELIDRMVVNHIVTEIGTKQFDAMDSMDRMDIMEEVRAQYTNEFSQHGLENLKLDYSNVVKN